MNEVSETITRWLEQKRREERASVAMICALALIGGLAVCLLLAILICALLFTFVRSIGLSGFIALVLTAGIFVWSIKRRPDERDLRLDPMGYWILKDICSFGPRMMLEGLRNLRRCGDLRDMNVRDCARALAYLAEKDAAVPFQDLMQHCPHVDGQRLRDQLLLLNGVLFLGDDTNRVTLMDPFRLRLRWMLEQEHRSAKWQEPVRPKAAPKPVPVNEPEKFSAYEILGLSPAASVAEIKTAYRKRMKECHPDLFAGMDQQAKELAERWTKALNAAYSTLKNQQGRVIASSPGRR